MLYTSSVMEQFIIENKTLFVIIVVLMILWTLPWKGSALWSAARLNHKWWFIILLATNTVAILDIIYLFAVAKKQKQKQDYTQ